MTTLPSSFAVFLSHNARDKRVVEEIAMKLRSEGIEPWLDAWMLEGGRPWQEDLGAGLASSSSFAFFVGPNGVGDWARAELEVALDRSVKDAGFRVFLVLLPGLAEPFDPTTLPPFLTMRTWVDLRNGHRDDRAFHLLRCAIKGIAPGPKLAPPPSASDVCPYRGLQTFHEEHADFFFGRESDTQRLVEKLKRTRFLAVLGASGSGKSSVVRAGLIPALRSGALPDSGAWRIRVMTPGSHPLQALAAFLADDDPARALHAYVDELSADARALQLHTARALRDRPPGERIVWVVDQFEEVFTLSRDDLERARFLENLLYAASIPDGRNIVVVTMRADFYPKCAAYPELSAQVASQQSLVSPMSVDGLRLAIEEPARRVGLELEEGLVETILGDIANQPGALPLLEHALLELWERRRGRMLTLEAYRETGGVEGAITKRADAVFLGFDEAQQAIARRVMLRLTQPGEGTEDTRRRATLSELVTHVGEADVVERVVSALADARLLTVSGGAGNGRTTG